MAGRRASTLMALLALATLSPAALAQQSAQLQAAYNSTAFHHSTCQLAVDVALVLDLSGQDRKPVSAADAELQRAFGILLTDRLMGSSDAKDTPETILAPIGGPNSDYNTFDAQSRTDEAATFVHGFDERGRNLANASHGAATLRLAHELANGKISPQRRRKLLQSAFPERSSADAADVGYGDSNGIAPLGGVRMGVAGYSSSYSQYSVLSAYSAATRGALLYGVPQVSEAGRPNPNGARNLGRGLQIAQLMLDGGYTSTSRRWQGRKHARSVAVVVVGGPSGLTSLASELDSMLETQTHLVLIVVGTDVTALPQPVTSHPMADSMSVFGLDSFAGLLDAQFVERIARSTCQPRCSAVSHCSACAARPDCGWCAAASRCLPINFGKNTDVDDATYETLDHVVWRACRDQTALATGSADACPGTMDFALAALNITRMDMSSPLREADTQDSDLEPARRAGRPPLPGAAFDTSSLRVNADQVRFSADIDVTIASRHLPEAIRAALGGSSSVLVELELLRDDGGLGGPATSVFHGSRRVSTAPGGEAVVRFSTGQLAAADVVPAGAFASGTLRAVARVNGDMGLPEANTADNDMEAALIEPVTISSIRPAYSDGVFPRLLPIVNRIAITTSAQLPPGSTLVLLQQGEPIMALDAAASARRGVVGASGAEYVVELRMDTLLTRLDAFDDNGEAEVALSADVVDAMGNRQFVTSDLAWFTVNNDPVTNALIVAAVAAAAELEYNGTAPAVGSPYSLLDPSTFANVSVSAANIPLLERELRSPGSQGESISRLAEAYLRGSQHLRVASREWAGAGVGSWVASLRVPLLQATRGLELSPADRLLDSGAREHTPAEAAMLRFAASAVRLDADDLFATLFVEGDSGDAKLHVKGRLNLFGQLGDQYLSGARLTTFASGSTASVELRRGNQLDAVQVAGARFQLQLPPLVVQEVKKAVGASLDAMVERGALSDRSRDIATGLLERYRGHTVGRYEYSEPSWHLEPSLDQSTPVFGMQLPYTCENCRPTDAELEFLPPGFDDSMVCEGPCCLRAGVVGRSHIYLSPIGNPNEPASAQFGGSAGRPEGFRMVQGVAVAAAAVAQVRCGEDYLLPTNLDNDLWGVDLPNMPTCLTGSSGVLNATDCSPLVESWQGSTQVGGWGGLFHLSADDDTQRAHFGSPITNLPPTGWFDDDAPDLEISYSDDDGARLRRMQRAAVAGDITRRKPSLTEIAEAITSKVQTPQPLTYSPAHHATLAKWSEASADRSEAMMRAAAAAAAAAGAGARSLRQPPTYAGGQPVLDGWAPWDQLTANQAGRRFDVVPGPAAGSLSVASSSLRGPVFASTERAGTTGQTNDWRACLYAPGTSLNQGSGTCLGDLDLASASHSPAIAAVGATEPDGEVTEAIVAVYVHQLEVASGGYDLSGPAFSGSTIMLSGGHAQYTYWFSPSDSTWSKERAVDEDATTHYDSQPSIAGAKATSWALITFVRDTDGDPMTSSDRRLMFATASFAVPDSGGSRPVFPTISATTAVPPLSSRSVSTKASIVVDEYSQKAVLMATVDSFSSDSPKSVSSTVMACVYDMASSTWASECTPVPELPAAAVALPSAQRDTPDRSARSADLLGDTTRSQADGGWVPDLTDTRLPTVAIAPRFASPGPEEEGDPTPASSVVQPHGAAFVVAWTAGSFPVWSYFEANSRTWLLDSAQPFELESGGPVVGGGAFSITSTPLDDWRSVLVQVTRDQGRQLALAVFATRAWPIPRSAAEEGTGRLPRPVVHTRERSIGSAQDAWSGEVLAPMQNGNPNQFWVGRRQHNSESSANTGLMRFTINHDLAIDSVSFTAFNNSHPADSPRTSTSAAVAAGMSGESGRSLQWRGDNAHPTNPAGISTELSSGGTMRVDVLVRNRGHTVAPKSSVTLRSGTRLARPSAEEGELTKAVISHAPIEFGALAPNETAVVTFFVPISELNRAASAGTAALLAFSQPYLWAEIQMPTLGYDADTDNNRLAVLPTVLTVSSVEFIPGSGISSVRPGVAAVSVTNNGPVTVELSTLMVQLSIYELSDDEWWASGSAIARYPFDSDRSWSLAPGESARDLLVPLPSGSGRKNMRIVLEHRRSSGSSFSFENSVTDLSLDRSLLRASGDPRWQPWGPDSWRDRTLNGPFADYDTSSDDAEFNFGPSFPTDKYTAPGYQAHVEADPMSATLRANASTGGIGPFRRRYTVHFDDLASTVRSGTQEWDATSSPEWSIGPQNPAPAHMAHLRSPGLDVLLQPGFGVDTAAAGSELPRMSSYRIRESAPGKLIVDVALANLGVVGSTAAVAEVVLLQRALIGTLGASGSRLNAAMLDGDFYDAASELSNPRGSGGGARRRANVLDTSSTSEWSDLRYVTPELSPRQVPADAVVIGGQTRVAQLSAGEVREVSVTVKGLQVRPGDYILAIRVASTATDADNSNQAILVPHSIRPVSLPVVRASDLSLDLHRGALVVRVQGIDLDYARNETMTVLAALARSREPSVGSAEEWADDLSPLGVGRVAPVHARAPCQLAVIPLSRQDQETILGAIAGADLPEWLGGVDDDDENQANGGDQLCVQLASNGRLRSDKGGWERRTTAPVCLPLDGLLTTSARNGVVTCPGMSRANAALGASLAHDSSSEVSLTSTYREEHLAGTSRFPKTSDMRATPFGRFASEFRGTSSGMTVLDTAAAGDYRVLLATHGTCASHRVTKDVSVECRVPSPAVDVRGTVDRVEAGRIDVDPGLDVEQLQAALREAFFTPEDLGALSMVVGGELVLDATSSARNDVDTGADRVRDGNDAEFLTGAELSDHQDANVLFSEDGRVPLSGTGLDSSGNTTAASQSVNAALRQWLVSLNRRWRGLSFRWEVLEAPRPSLSGTVGVSAASATYSWRKWLAPHQCTLAPEAPELPAAARRLFEADDSSSSSPSSGSGPVRTQWFRTPDSSLASGSARTQRSWFEAELEPVTNATSTGLDLVRWLGRTQAGRALARAIMQGEAYTGVPQDHWRQLIHMPEGSLMRFTPTVAGNYRLRLTVNHGCSETVREVQVDVRCPSAGVTGAPGVRGNDVSLRKPPAPVWDGASQAWMPLQLNPSSRSDPKSAFHPHLDRARVSTGHAFNVVDDDEARKEIADFVDATCPNLRAHGLHAEREAFAHIGDASLGYEWSIVDFDPLPPQQQPTAMDRSGRVRRHSDPFVSPGRVLQPSDVVVAGVAADSALATFYTCGVLAGAVDASGDEEASRRLEPQSAEDRLRWALRAPVAFVNVSDPLVSRSVASYTSTSHEMAVQFRGGASAFGRPAVPRFPRGSSQDRVRVTRDDSSASPSDSGQFTDYLTSSTTLTSSSDNDATSYYETSHDDVAASWHHRTSERTWSDVSHFDRMPATVSTRHIRVPAPVVSGVSTMAFNTTRTASVNVTVRRTTERLTTRRSVVARDQAVLYRRFTPSPILHLPRHVAACQGAVTLKVRRYPLCNPSAAHESTVVVRSSCDALVVPRLQASSRLVLALPSNEYKSFDSLAHRSRSGWHSLAGAALFPHVAVQVEGMAKTHSGAASEAAEALRARARGAPIRIPVVDGAAAVATLAGSPFKGPSGRSDQQVTHRVMLVRAPTGSKFHRESLVYRLGDPDAVRPAVELTAGQQAFLDRLGAVKHPEVGSEEWRSPLRHPAPFGSVNAQRASPYSAFGSIGGGAAFSHPDALWMQADTPAGTQELLQHYFPSADRVPGDWLLPVDQDSGALLFRPDTPGEFVFAVASSTQCATAYDTVRVVASCRAINPSLELNAAAGSTWTHTARYFPMARLSIPQLEQDGTRIVTDNDPAAASYPGVIEALVGAVPTSGNSLSTLNRGVAPRRGPTGRRTGVNDQSPTAVAGQSRANIIAVWQLQRQVGGEFYTVVSKDDLEADGIKQYRYDLNGFDDDGPLVHASAPNSGVDSTRPLLAVGTQRRGVFPIDRLNAMALPHRPGVYRIMANVTDGCGWTATATPSFNVRCRDADIKVFRDAEAGTLQTLSTSMPAAVSPLAGDWPSVYETLSSFVDVPESVYKDEDDGGDDDDDSSTTFEQLNSNVYADGTIRWDDAPPTELWGEDVLTFTYWWYNGVADWPDQLRLPQVSHIELDGMHTAVTSQWSNDYLDLYDTPEFSWQDARLVRQLDPVEAVSDPSDSSANTVCTSSGLVSGDEGKFCRDSELSVDLTNSGGSTETGAATLAVAQVSMVADVLFSSVSVNGAATAEKPMDGYSSAALSHISAGYWEVPALFWDGCQSTVLRQVVKADCPALLPRARLEVEPTISGTTEPMPVVDVVTDDVLGPVLRLHSYAEQVPSLHINLTETTIGGMLLPDYRLNVTASQFWVRWGSIEVDREEGAARYPSPFSSEASADTFDFASLDFGMYQFEIIYSTGCREVRQRFVVEVVCNGGAPAQSVLDQDEPTEHSTATTFQTATAEVTFPLSFVNVTSGGALGSTRVRADGVTIYSAPWLGFRQYEPTGRQFRAEIDTDALPLSYWDGLNYTEANSLGLLNPSPFSWQLDSWYAYRTLDSEVQVDAGDVSSLSPAGDKATVTFSAPGATKIVVSKTGQCTKASGSIWIENACPALAVSKVQASVDVLNAAGAEMVTDPADSFAARAASPTAAAIVEFDFNDTMGHTGSELFARGAVVAGGIPASSGAFPSSALRLPSTYYGAKYSVELVGFEPTGVFASQSDWNLAVNAIMPASTPVHGAADEAAGTLATLGRPIVRGDILFKVTAEDRCHEVSTSTIRLRATCPQDDPDTQLYVVTNNDETTNSIEWGSFLDVAFGNGQFDALDDDEDTEDAAYPFTISTAMLGDNATAFAADHANRHLPTSQHHYLGFEATQPLPGESQRFELTIRDTNEPRSDGETGFVWSTTTMVASFAASPTPGWTTGATLNLEVGDMGEKVNVTSPSFAADQPTAMAAILVYTADDGGCGRTGGTVTMDAKCPDMSSLFTIDTSSSDGFAFCSSTGGSSAQAANLAIRVSLSDTANSNLTLGSADVDVVKVEVYDVTDTTLDPSPRYSGLATANAKRFEAMPVLLATLAAGTVPEHNGAKFVTPYTPTAADLASRTLQFRADFFPEIDPRLDTERDLLAVVYTSCGPVATKNFGVSVKKQVWDMDSSVELTAPWNPDVGAFTTKLSVPMSLGDGVQVQDNTRGLRTILSGGVQGPLLRQGPSFAAYAFDDGVAKPFSPGVIAWRWVSSGAPAATLDDEAALDDDSMDDPFVRGNHRTAPAPGVSSRVEDDDAALLAWFAANPGQAPFAGIGASGGVHCVVRTQTRDERVAVAPIEGDDWTDSAAPNAAEDSLQRTRHSLAAVRQCSPLADGGSSSVLPSGVTDDPGMSTVSWDAVTMLDDSGSLEPAAFLPVAGSYATFELTLDDGCQRKQSTVRVSAKCAEFSLVAPTSAIRMVVPSAAAYSYIPLTSTVTPEAVASLLGYADGADIPGDIRGRAQPGAGDPVVVSGWSAGLGSGPGAAAGIEGAGGNWRTLGPASTPVGVQQAERPGAGGSVTDPPARHNGTNGTVAGAASANPSGMLGGLFGSEAMPIVAVGVNSTGSEVPVLSDRLDFSWRVLSAPVGSVYAGSSMQKEVRYAARRTLGWTDQSANARANADPSVVGTAPSRVSEEVEVQVRYNETSSVVLTNTHGTAVAFVPDRPGAYVLEVTAADSCPGGSRTTAQVSVEAACPYDLSLRTARDGRSVTVGAFVTAAPAASDRNRQRVADTGRTTAAGAHGSEGDALLQGDVEGGVVTLAAAVSVGGGPFSDSLASAGLLARRSAGVLWANEDDEGASNDDDSVGQLTFPAALTASWVLISKPAASGCSNGSIIDANSLRPAFLPDVEGEYEFAATVSDGCAEVTEPYRLYVGCRSVASPTIVIDRATGGKKLGAVSTDWDEQATSRFVLRAQLKHEGGLPSNQMLTSSVSTSWMLLPSLATPAGVDGAESQASAAAASDNVNEAALTIALPLAVGVLALGAALAAGYFLFKKKA